MRRSPDSILVGSPRHSFLLQNREVARNKNLNFSYPSNRTLESLNYHTLGNTAGNTPRKRLTNNGQSHGDFGDMCEKKGVCWWDKNTEHPEKRSKDSLADE